MICESIYDSLEAIPEELRGEFEQKDGKWQLKADAIPGVGALFNAGLVANERRAVDQVKAKGQRIKDLEAEVLRLGDQAAVLQDPNSVTLSKADADAWKKYTALGTPKDIESKLTEFETVKVTAEKFNLRETLSKLSADVQLNSAVLEDWALSAEGKDLQFTVKEVVGKDPKTGQEVTTKVPMVKVQTMSGNKTVETEVELLTYAKENLPEWKYAALTSAVEKLKTTVPVNAVTMPNLGSATSSPGTPGTVKPVDKFNEARAAKPNPFMPAAKK